MLVVAYPRLVIHDVQLPDKERDDTSDVAWRPQLQEVVISVRVDDAGYKFVVVSNTWTISISRWGLIPRLPAYRDLIMENHSAKSRQFTSILEFAWYRLV